MQEMSVRVQNSETDWMKKQQESAETFRFETAHFVGKSKRHRRELQSICPQLKMPSYQVQCLLI